MFFIKMEVKYIIITMCILYSIAMENTLDDEEIMHLWNTYETEYGKNFDNFKIDAKNGLIPSLQQPEIDNLFNAIKSADKEYVTFSDLSKYYGVDTDELLDMLQKHGTVCQADPLPDELYRKMQDHGTQCEAEPGPVRKIYKMDIGQFRKVVNLGLVPRCAGLYDVFRGIIGGDRRDYLYLSDMIAHYGTDYDHNIFSLDHIIKKYGVPKGNGQRLYFDGFSKAMSLNYLPKPRILQHQR
ncbi:uncharacterized protein LOC126834452 isoform X2 [Adelges cooleyi]|uniref:uncharacterized protein LOC126834452 isoform X2 n=1 Tax=Adelges cooleyi TaxID=133065 RepID=UPI00217F3A22|nr:uncharacterized protein LOC126834452 isoform X2 [Adelges cooleyi]